MKPRIGWGVVLLLALSSACGSAAAPPASAPQPAPPADPTAAVLQSTGPEPSPVLQTSGEQSAPPLVRSAGPNRNYAVVRTFFATDRRLREEAPPAERFGSERGPLTFGCCEVSIPRDHRLGELEKPSLWRLELREDPEKHVVLLAVEPLARERFFADVQGRVQGSARKQAFVFVHGYNATFEDAARRTAQISYDLGFDGAPVFYSWPSQGATAAYTIDEQSAEWAQSDLQAFLEAFLTLSGAEHVYLIAHSMGNRALTRAAAALLAEHPALRERVEEVILAAPDIDADVFKRDIAPALTAAGRPVTLYASSQDVALAASKKVHGAPRAGDSERGVLVIAGIESIDASGVDTSLLGHSYFADTRSVLSDLFQLVSTRQRASARSGLREVKGPSGRYWAFQP